MLNPQEFRQHGKDSPWFVFFGSKISTNSEAFTSLWLDIQYQADKENITRYINIAKVECTKFAVFCQENNIKYFPTLI